MSDPLSRPAAELPKVPTGIRGFDEISYGGLPRHRATLVCGGAGCGKSLFAAIVCANVVNGGGQAAFLSFEERPEAIASNAASIGLNLHEMQSRGDLVMQYVGPPEDVAVEIGDYNLDGLLLRLELLVNTHEIDLVVLDTVETLFGMFSNQRAIRSELLRLFRWLTERGLTLLITAESGVDSLTRFGLEEYVSDCVVSLDHELNGDVSTRRLRILKYRGSGHETNRFPFLIGDDGFTVLPVTSARLDHDALLTHVSTGQPQLDEALDGKGVWQGSTVLLSGSPGSGKSIFSGQFACDFCGRGGRALFISFEESSAEVVRNLAQAGIDLQPHLNSGVLAIRATRPTMLGIEMHLVAIFKLIEEHKPSVVVIDPVTSFDMIASPQTVQRTVVRLIDVLKSRNITVWLTAAGTDEVEVGGRYDLLATIDNWLHVSLEREGQAFGKVLRIAKARGVKHSRSQLAFEITSEGVLFEGDPVSVAVEQELADE